MRSRQHVNPLALGFQTFSGELPELAAGRPVELEIGCADAQFLFERAAVEPDRVYVGLEIRSHLVDEVNRLARQRAMPVQAVFCNANHHLSSIIPAGRVRRVYLNFPDPWFKKRHRKRRMIDPGLARDIHRVLEPDGEVFVQTDVWDIALDALETFEGLDHLFANRVSGWSFWKDGNPFRARSWREQHCEEDGLPIWRLRYQRLDQAAQAERASLNPEPAAASRAPGLDRAARRRARTPDYSQPLSSRRAASR